MAEFEAWLVRKVQLRPDGWLISLRADALEIADQLGVPSRRSGIEDLIGAVARTRPVRSGAAPVPVARRAGLEFDPARIERVDQLAEFLAVDRVAGVLAEGGAGFLGQAVRCAILSGWGIPTPASSATGLVRLWCGSGV